MVKKEKEEKVIGNQYVDKKDYFAVRHVRHACTFQGYASSRLLIASIAFTRAFTSSGASARRKSVKTSKKHPFRLDIAAF